METKLILTFILSLCYGFFELFMSRRIQNKITTPGDKGSIWVLSVSIATGYWLSFLIASTNTGRIYNWDTLFILGLLIVTIGLIIRITSILALKQQFTYTVTKVDNHGLIQTGIYKKIRHPGYLGQLIIFLGLSTCLSNWISIILMFVSVFPGFLNRISVEEKFMADHFGQQYLDYKAHTKRLIPFIY